MQEEKLNKELTDVDPELELLSRINPDAAILKIMSSKKLRKEFGIHLSPYKKTDADIGRNDPCPCGSGLKYKKCCGK